MHEKLKSLPRKRQSKRERRMADTGEELSTELEYQKRVNGKLLALLRAIDGAGLDQDGKVGPMIDEVERTKQILEEAQIALDAKLLSR